MEEKERVWHREVISPAVEHALEELRQLSVLAPFYLAGGTGLALQFGHRRSEDVDFFTQEPFSPEELVAKLRKLGEFSLLAVSPDTLHVQIHEIKVSFLGYVYPVLFPLGAFLNLDVADPRDIACMKLSALASRGTRRDFVDLYAASKGYGLGQLLEFFRQKYAQANYSLIHVLKSLTYFEDAEKEPMPAMLVPLSWEEVKQFFREEIPRLAQAKMPRV